MKKRIISAIIAAIIVIMTASVCIPVSAKEYSLGENHAHTWTYYSEGDTLCASCDCGAFASVTIDTDPVYEMARHYYGGEVNYSVIRENGWYEFDDILSYIPLYSGYEVFSADNTALYTDIYERPDTNGSYNVRLAVFENDDPDEGKEIATTDSIAYYLPMVPISDCTITEFGDTEIYQGEPQKDSDGTYLIYDYVNLAWVNKNDSNANVKLMCDIVANPILIRDDGTVVSSRYIIYSHDGFGVYGTIWKYHNFFKIALPNDGAYTGTFDGNGHTIYGLYSVSDSEKTCAGLIESLSPSGHVKDVTIDNFYFIGVCSGGIAGALGKHEYASISGDLAAIKNCKVLNGYIGTNAASSTAENNGCGGIVGYLEAHDISDAIATPISDCISYATVCGEYAGGIVGTYISAYGGESIFIENCVNAGEVTGNNAGGLVGRIVANHTSSDGDTLHFNGCKNLGKISGRDSSAGGVAFFDNNSSSGGNVFCLCLDVQTYGAVYDTQFTGAALGRIENGLEAYICARYANVARVYGTSTDGMTLYDVSAPVDYDITNLSALCNGNHTPSPTWELTSVPTCTGHGSMVNKCLVCGEILDEQTVPSDGHMFEEQKVGKYYENICVYCGINEDDAYDEDDEDMLASVFATDDGTIIGIALIAIAVIVCVISAVIMKKGKSLRVLSVILAVSMLSTVMYITPSAAVYSTDCTSGSHDWKYTTEGDTIKASCSKCGKRASVTIDTSNVFEVNKTYTGGDFNYSVVYEDDWSAFDDLYDYVPVYNGTVTVSPTETAEYTDKYNRPTQTGVYTVSLNICDGNGKTVASTGAVPFYIATISLDKCTITDAPDSQPGSVWNSRVSVSNALELINAARQFNNGTLPADTSVYLNNDIIVNPIIIRDDGTIMSASYTVYKYEPFGNSNRKLNNFYGNGHIVYGLYCVNTAYEGVAGLVGCIGSNSKIRDVTVAHSYLFASSSGAICGQMILSENQTEPQYYYDTDRNERITYCTSVDCIIGGTLTTQSANGTRQTASAGGQGGIVGLISHLETCTDNTPFKDCYNYSDVNGEYAGGIAGCIIYKGADLKSDPQIKLCTNSGTVSGAYAGGIVGCITYFTDGSANSILNACENIGTVRGERSSGGLIGWQIGNHLAEYTADLSTEYRWCISLGCVYGAGNSGSIVGMGTQSTGISVFTQYLNDCRTATENLGGKNLIFTYNCSYKSVSLNLATVSDVCTHLGFSCQHVYAYYMTTNGAPLCSGVAKLERMCLLCGKITESHSTPTYKHSLDGDVCTVCGLEAGDDSDGPTRYGSVFSEGSVLFLVGSIAMLASVAVLGYVLVKNKKKHQTVTEAE